MSDDKVVQLKDKINKTKDATLQKGMLQNNERICCSFCGRENTKVLKMVKGPGVNICSECVMIAVQYLILNDSMPSKEAQKILDMFWGNGNNIG